jgi:hypothetical protein
MRIKIWKNSEGVDFWMPVEAMVDERMKLARAIANRFPVSKHKECWWLTCCGGAPVREGFNHGDEFEWNEGDKAEFRSFHTWERETREAKRGLRPPIQFALERPLVSKERDQEPETEPETAHETGSIESHLEPGLDMNPEPLIMMEARPEPTRKRRTTIPCRRSDSGKCFTVDFAEEDTCGQLKERLAELT